MLIKLQLKVELQRESAAKSRDGGTLESLQGKIGGSGLGIGVYFAVGVTARVEERVGRGVGEFWGCGVGLGRGVFVAGTGVGKGVLVAGAAVGAWGVAVAAGGAGLGCLVAVGMGVLVGDIGCPVAVGG